MCSLWAQYSCEQAGASTGGDPSGLPLHMKCTKWFSFVPGADAVLQPWEGPALAFPSVRWFGACGKWMKGIIHVHTALLMGQRSEGGSGPSRSSAGSSKWCLCLSSVSQDCALSECSSGQMQPQQHLPVHWEMLCRRGDHLKMRFSLCFGCPAPFIVIKCKPRGRELILFRALLYLCSFLLCLF